MDPIGRKLNSEEKSVLTVLLQEGRGNHDRTAASIAVSLERDPVDVAGVLTRLEADGLTTSTADAEGEDYWSATGDAAEAL
jgi:DNA-binding MarR family transcriptional regulator